MVTVMKCCLLHEAHSHKCNDQDDDKNDTITREGEQTQTHRQTQRQTRGGGEFDKLAIGLLEDLAYSCWSAVDACAPLSMPLLWL
jgi:hypothetical protein